MTRKNAARAARVVALIVIGAALGVPASARRTTAQKKQTARTQFDNAERMREALNGRAVSERSRRDYNRVIDAYRAVYFTAPTSNRADASVVAVAELMVAVGRQFRDEKALHAAIGQYEFLRREYPGSRFRMQGLFTIAQIYKDDLDDAAQARTTFEEFLKRYPHSELVADARDAIKELDQQAKTAEKPKPPAKTAKQEPPPPPPAEPKHATLVTGIRHWSTPDYTRVAIDLQDEVDYQFGRIPNPDRVFFDLHNTHLSSTLKGKTFDVEDGFLHKVRVAQYQQDETRIVLEMDDIADYSAFLLPNPYRLIIDVHGKHPQKMATAEPAKPAPREAEKKAAKRASEPAAKPAAPAEVTRTEPVADKTRETAAGASAAPAGKPKPDATFDELAETVAKVNPPEVASKEKNREPEAKPAAKAAREPVATTGKHGKAAAKKAPEPSPGHEAQPTANGERSLIRALGLKIGRIVVDAGHGGHDTGTIAPNGLLEKDLVLDVALRLGKLLDSRMGAEVVYTRDDDTFIPLETRTAIANQNEADLFISIHANSSRDPSARGIETYYLNFTTSADALEVAARENAVSEKSIHELQDLVKKIALKDKIEESREFAVDVQQALYNGLANRGLRNRGVKKAPFIVLIGANMPSILAEISFVSNPADAKRLRTPDYRQKIAESIYRGTAKYVSGLSGMKVASRLSRPVPTAAASAAPHASSQ
ncbi:MAG TPA: N-acetylmuramoyl-L-alanine amidase [Terriglobales bacterium]